MVKESIVGCIIGADKEMAACRGCDSDRVGRVDSERSGKLEKGVSDRK